VWLVVLIVALSLALHLSQSALGQTGDDPLGDPLTLGAWLYEGKCVSCHGAYEKARLGENYDTDELTEKVKGGSRGCQVNWARRLGKHEIQALVLYMQTWEELGRNPDLPLLPPQPTPTPWPTKTEGDGNLRPTESPTPTVEIPADVQRAIQDNTLALGAWLYTRHCYRCHLSYEYGRQGIGLEKDKIERTIENGKAGTTMPPFSRQQGGTLKASEIHSIVTYILAFEQLNAPPALPDVLFIPPTPDPASLQTIPLPKIPRINGNAENGATVYVVHCQDCHGTQGIGQVGPRLVKAWPSARPDLTIQRTIRDGVPGTLMPAWGQAGGGPLTEAQLGDLTALILQWRSEIDPTAPAQSAALPGWLWLMAAGWGGLLAVGVWGKFRRVS
jgi:mono/diheme cytochrome c family protein